jgi:protein involved in polysaccharide export with SLBB domain
MIKLFFLLTLPPIPQDYELQIGDKITITISGAINFTFSQRISPEGKIFIQSGGLPLISPARNEVVPSGATVLGTVEILGLTIEEAEEKIEGEFKKYFKNIDVSLTVTEFSDLIYVEGAVVRPGAYPFFPSKTVQDYLGLAGGPLTSGDIENVKITTSENKIINGNLDFSPPRNSVIFVPKVFVYVKGEVKRPGSFPYNPSMNVSQYIGMAGGLTDRADLKRSYVIKKDGTKISIHKTHIEKGDIIVVKGVFLKWWQDYVAIVGGVISTIYLFTLIKDIGKE